MFNSVEIEIGGELRKFHFGLGFLGELIDSFNLDIVTLGEVASKNPLKYDPIIMYCSAVYALKREGKTASFTQYDFIDWIENSGGIKSEPMLKFNEAFIKSLTKDVPIDTTEVKKKVRK
jgi:hypothetical protein